MGKTIFAMDSDDRFQTTNCLLPCTFMEYQVSTYNRVSKYIIDNISATDIVNESINNINYKLIT